MIRRHSIPRGIRYFYRSNPRKWTSFLAPNNFTDTTLYHFDEIMKQPPAYPEWIGKLFIPYHISTLNQIKQYFRCARIPYDPNNYILEQEIERIVSPYSFRIYYVRKGLIFKGDVRYRPMQVNIFLNLKNIIVDVMLF